MSLLSSRWARILPLAMAAIILATGGTSAQSIFAKRLQTIYEGNPLTQSGMKLGSWGSGMCEESSQNSSVGSKSIKVTPKDLYAGGRIDFVSPFDLTQSVNNPNGYIQFVCQFWGAQATDEFTQSLGTAAAPTGMYEGETVPGKQVQAVRVVLFLENGPAVELQAPLSAFKVGEDGWMVVSFPLAVVKAKANLSQYRVSRMVITGDGTEPFHIGEIRTVPDSEPLTADSNEDLEVSKNYPIAFQGFSRNGASAVKYGWDFNQRDGVQEEAVGDLVYHRFTQAGDYTVTLTVTDVFGVKDKVTKVIRVKVNE